MDKITEIHAAKRIIDSIEKETHYHLVMAGEKQVIPFLQKDILRLFCLCSGGVDMRRLSDNTIVAHIDAPAVAGLSLSKDAKILHYLKTTSPTQLKVISHETGMHIINKNNLWKEAFLLSNSMINISYIRDEHCISRNVYEIVRQHIELIWELDIEIRSSISVFDFILSRTNISRSSICKILKDLSVGGYIEINRGRLAKKTHLPQHY